MNSGGIGNIAFSSILKLFIAVVIEVDIGRIVHSSWFADSGSMKELLDPVSIRNDKGNFVGGLELCMGGMLRVWWDLCILSGS